MYWVVCGVLLIVAVLLSLSVLPPKYGLTSYAVLSGSMEPSIHTGSVVFVKSTSEYKIGDVVTFKTNNPDKIPTTHRVHEMRAISGVERYVTKGDANDDIDSRELSKPDIIGKVTFSIPFLGYLTSAVRTPAGFIVVILIPAALIVIGELQKIYIEARKVIRIRKQASGVSETTNETNHEKRD